MKIAMLGATGRTGRAVVDEALRRGHHVRADLAVFLLDVAEDTGGLFRRRAPFVSW